MVLGGVQDQVVELGHVVVYCVQGRKLTGACINQSKTLLDCRLFNIAVSTNQNIVIRQDTCRTKCTSIQNPMIFKLPLVLSVVSSQVSVSTNQKNCYNMKV